MKLFEICFEMYFLCEVTQMMNLGDVSNEMVDATKGKVMETDKISRLCKYSLFSRLHLTVPIFFCSLL